MALGLNILNNKSCYFIYNLTYVTLIYTCYKNMKRQYNVCHKNTWQIS